MSALGVVLAMGVGVFALRIVGLLLPDLTLPPAWDRALRFVPIAVLTALTLSTLGARGDDGTARVLAAIGAGLIAWRTRQMWACIAGGMAMYWLLRLV